MKKDLLSLKEMSREEFDEVMRLAAMFKKTRGTPAHPRPLEGKSIGMIFAKSSTRTRLSFEVGIHELGGYPLYLDQSKLQIGRGESIYDTAKVMSRYLHGVVIRTFSHNEVVELAGDAAFPVINALTDEFHPCQVLADFFTVLEHSRTFEGVKMTYIGDGACNMPNTLIIGAKLAGIDLVIAAPEAYKPNLDILVGTEHLPGSVTWVEDPIEAVKDANYIYTDVWVSMGCEAEAAERLRLLAPYQVNEALVSAAAPDVKVLHCLPAKRGEEITDAVMDGTHSIVFDEAENRLHVQKAVMSMLMGK